MYRSAAMSPLHRLYRWFMDLDPRYPVATILFVYLVLGLTVLGFNRSPMLLHIKQSYYTFFYAALLVGSTRFLWFHAKAWQQTGFFAYIQTRFIESRFWLRPVLLGAIAGVAMLIYSVAIVPAQATSSIDWKFDPVSAEQSGLTADKKGNLIEQLDPRIQHIAKWLVAETEGIAAGDINGDGLLDLFASQSLKEESEKAVLYINRGDYRFEKQLIPALQKVIKNPQQEGLVTNGVFADYDNDGDQDLFITEVFGPCRMLQNQGAVQNFSLTDVSTEIGLTGYCQSLGASFLDVNRDGLLDIFIGNVLEENLPGYQQPTRLNLFKLPQPEYAGDERMFNFMHESWNLSNNGGVNQLYLQTPDHHFVLQDAHQWNMPDTRWSLAVGSADFNKDGWPDVYVANDFGPDDLYFNVNGREFKNIKGTIFGSIGKDTYKGMNVSIADFDHSGYLDVYVSNVHHALQAEGSLLWKFSPAKSQFYPEIEEVATRKGALNENRFGWGAVATDFDNDGWVDLAQANGMVDDTYDKKFEECPDYWYVNEKIARSPPEIHRYANRWGDIRGYCIFGKERNRLYLNRGPSAKPQFVDVAEKIGMTELASSRAAVSADFSNSGRRDVLFSHPFNKPSLYRNRFLAADAAAPAWVGFALQGNSHQCNRDAIGSHVDLLVRKKNGESYRISQEVQSVSGLLGQSDRRLHFGLGHDVDKVEAQIQWCGQMAQQVIPDLNTYNHLQQQEIL